MAGQTGKGQLLTRVRMRPPACAEFGKEQRIRRVARKELSKGEEAAIESRKKDCVCGKKRSVLLGTYRK